VHGTMTNAKGMVQRLNAALPAPGDAKPHWEILGHLARKLDADGCEYPDARAVHREMVANVSAFAGAQWGRTALPIQLRFAGSRG
jgi:predicted molibdopterin-dependent oxidoreductase YjgC